MLELLKPFWIEIIKYGGMIMGIIIVLFKTRQSGKEFVERKEAMETLKGVQISDKIDNNIANVDNNHLERLRKKINRD